MENIQQFLSDNPVIYGIFLLLLGLFLLLGAIFGWNWIFGNVSPVNYDFGKIDGLVNFFGQKTARIIFGTFSVLVMLGGVLVIWLSLTKRI
jgi:hypothetical protein